MLKTWSCCFGLSKAPQEKTSGKASKKCQKQEKNHQGLQSLQKLHKK